jgi:voltage-gated potassium channel
MEIRRRLAYALITLLVVLAISVSGYHLLGDHVPFLDALYMAVITLAGVGYGEIVPTAGHPVLRIFNMFVVLIGVTLTVYVFSVVTAFLVEGEISNIFWRRKMEKRIRELRHHYIVCGLGDTGRCALSELQKTKAPFVVIEAHEDSVNKLRELPEFNEVLFIVGDATDEEVLDKAGIEHAKGLISALAGDKDNLVITVMAHQKNPHLRIVTRYTEEKYGERMLKAGATSAVSPNTIGGMRLASEVLRPHVVSFLDLMLKQHGRTLRIEEVDVGPGWAGHTISELKIRERFNLLVLATKDSGSNAHFVPNPPDTTVVDKGSVIIVMGEVDDLHRARKDAEHHGLAAAMQMQP